MRIKKIIKILLIIFCLVFSTCVISEFVQAVPARIQVVGEPSYYLYEIVQNPPKYYYYINITFHNSGNASSVPVDIKIIEDGKIACWPPESHEVSFKPYESRNFTFKWGTTFTKKSVIITYAPSDPNTLPTEYNNGSRILEISYVSKDGVKNTPGFEISIAILVLLIFICFKNSKIKKKNNY